MRSRRRGWRHSEPSTASDHGERDEPGEQAVDLLDGGVAGRHVDELLVVAARPVVAPEPGAGEAHRGAGHDDDDQQPEGDRRDGPVAPGRDPHADEATRHRTHRAPSATLASTVERTFLPRSLRGELRFPANRGGLPGGQPRPSHVGRGGPLIRRLLCAAAVAGFAVLGVAAGTAAAQQDSSELLQGNVRNEAGRGRRGRRGCPSRTSSSRSPQPGGAEVGIATTDAEGHYELAAARPRRLHGHDRPGDAARRTSTCATRPRPRSRSTSARPSARSSTTSSARIGAPDRVAPRTAPPDDRQRHQVRPHHRHHGRSGCR